MKYIQDESTSRLIIYSIIFLLLCLLSIVWEIYDKRKSQDKGEYREWLQIIRAWFIALIALMGFVICLEELFKRL